MPETDAQICQN